MADGEDWELLQLYVRQGSHSAFAQLAAKYARFVHAIALRRTRDPHLAEDVTQAVFIVLARRAQTLPHAVSIAGWLHRTTVYTAVSAMRSENRRRHHEQVAASYSSVEFERDDAVVDADDLTGLDEAIRSLPLRDREVLALHFFEGCRVREVGVRLGISREAAAKRLARAVRRLRGAVAGKESGVTVGAALLLTSFAQLPEAAGANAATVATAGSIAGGFSLGAVSAGAGRAFDLASNMVQTLRLLTLRKVAAAVLLVMIAVAAPLLVRKSVPLSDDSVACEKTGARVTLVSEGDYFLEKNLGVVADTQRIAPSAYPPAEVATDRDAVLVFDGFAPQRIPAEGRFIWINALPPGRGFTALGESGLRQMATLARPVGWREEHPILKDINLSQLRIASQLRLGLPSGAKVLVDGSQGPLFILDQDERSTHLVVAFSPRESTWPLHPSFGQFLKQAVDYLVHRPGQADVTGPLPSDSPDALAQNCPGLRLTNLPQRRPASSLALILVTR